MKQSFERKIMDILMTGGRIKLICQIAMAFLFIFSAPCLAEQDYIDITNPSLRRIPIAIPLFRIMPQGQVNTQVSRNAPDLCAENLEFTGYFKILDRGAFLENPRESDITGSTTNFRNWTGIGAELLITGGIWINDGTLTMELRLFDTFKSQILLGKKYTAGKDKLKKVMRTFCNEVIYYLTGRQGIFDSDIAFVSTSSGNKEIYLCDFDGQNSRAFTHHKTITLFPAWSSDGKWIAYTSYARGKPDIFIKHLQEKRGFVIQNKGINITPAWVPGQFKLAATLSMKGTRIFIC